MKALVFVLVVANLLFYAFGAGYFGRPDNPDAGRIDRQVKPERMRIVARGEPPSAAEAQGKPAEPVTPAPAVPGEVAQVCISWPHLTAAQADRIVSLMAANFADFNVARENVVSGSSGWWVFIPPLADKPEADRKAAELRQLGVSDFFVINEGPNRFAISLGIFSTEKAGQEQLAALKAKGVRSARLGARPGKESFSRVEANGPAAAGEKAVRTVAKVFPKVVVEDCP